MPARRVAEIFRGKKDNETTSQLLSQIEIVSEEEKVRKMSLKELLSNYNPKENDNFIYERLKKLSNGKPCIIFNDDGSVNVEESSKVFEAIKGGFAIDTLVVNNKPRRVFPLGESFAEFLMKIQCFLA
ncbi:MAG: hypothetical protein HC836_47060 [Richelia sp. RM2_1_2]|nr:hypothetical protein [Richelia sp. RM2_1_2]